MRPLFLQNFQKRNLNLLCRLSKNTQVSNFMKNRAVRADLFHAERHIDYLTDGRIDRHDELIVAFRNFANAPKWDAQSLLLGGHGIMP